MKGTIEVSFEKKISHKKGLFQGNESVFQGNERDISIFQREKENYPRNFFKNEGLFQGNERGKASFISEKEKYLGKIKVHFRVMTGAMHFFQGKIKTYFRVN